MSHQSIQYQAPCIQATVVCPVGTISVSASHLGITHLTMASVAETPDEAIETQLLDTLLLENGSGEPHPTHLFHARIHLIKMIRQLQEYFAGTRLTFDVPLAAKGTEFQQQVWQALTQMQYGEACCYSDIAEQINRPKAMRAVGAANGANPIAIVVPCHRVIGKNGKLTGYAHGLPMKSYLLSLESKYRVSQ
ncbi:methylated-DNA--[protein]-cysteine S-methyltransferase [Shewanella maritima]|uniref:methylated-DNA--[protein]-cysteine S-methyltransferase n=1 Tax=Shewanella maritima TaxID=2520507 RepID=UPI00373662DF